MSFVDRAARQHARSVLRLHGRTRTYRRADGAEAELVLAATNSKHEETDRRGVVVTVRADDWLVEAAAFRSAFGESSEPEDGDAIVAGGRTYVVGPAGGDECWRRSDNTGTLWRIHSKDHGADA